MQFGPGIVAVLHRCDDRTNVGTIVRVYEARTDGPPGDDRQFGWYRVEVVAPTIVVREDAETGRHYVWMSDASAWAHEDDMVPLRHTDGDYMTFEPEEDSAEAFTLAVH